jgi:hypothetical protein
VKNDKVSSDMGKLKELISINIPASKIQWEVFGTPEYTGGVPGPTDFITLVAEIDPVDTKLIEKFELPAGKQFVVPEAGRAWLSSNFRNTLEKIGSYDKELPNSLNCKKYATTIRKSGRKIDGFICHDGKSYLLYLTLENRL